MSFPANLNQRYCHLLQCGHGFFSFVFLLETDRSVDQDDSCDHDHIKELTQNQGYESCNKQDHHHDGGHLFPDDTPGTFPTGFFQLVKSAFFQALCCHLVG